MSYGDDQCEKFSIPDIIYLQCHDDDGVLYDVGGEKITWCEDDIDGHNIKYIRDKEARKI